MTRNEENGISRRSLLRRAAAASAFGPLFQATKGVLSAQTKTSGPSKLSAPSALQITDIRGCTVASNYDYPIIRIDTNQDVYGLGEVFCNDMISQALLLKPFLVGQNPLQIENLLQSVRRFTTQGPSSGGFSAIDIAGHFDIDADSDPETDSDLRISGYQLYFRNRTGGPGMSSK